MHVANIRPKKNWSTLEDLVTEAINETGTLAEGKTYEIYNNGGSDRTGPLPRKGTNSKRCRPSDSYGSSIPVYYERKCLLH